MSLKDTCQSGRSSEKQTDFGLSKKTGAKILFLAEDQPSLQNLVAFPETGPRNSMDWSRPDRKTEVWDVDDEDCCTLELFPRFSNGSQMKPPETAEGALFMAEMDCAERGPTSPEEVHPDQEHILGPGSKDGLLSSEYQGTCTLQRGPENHLTRPSTLTIESVCNKRAEHPEYSGLIWWTDRKTSTSDSNNNTKNTDKGAWRLMGVRDPTNLSRYTPLKALEGQVHLWEDHQAGTSAVGHKPDQTSPDLDIHDHLSTVCADDSQKAKNRAAVERLDLLNFGCIFLNQPSDQKSPNKTGDPPELEENWTVESAGKTQVRLEICKRIKKVWDIMENKLD